MNANPGRSPIVLRMIGGFKLLTALALFGLGVGVFRNVHSDLGQEAEHIIGALKLDPGNYYIHSAVEKISGATAKQLYAISFGTFAYALLSAVEATGLLLRKRWGEYFTVIASGGLIPVEVYELLHKATAVRLAILAINIAIVVYLVFNLIRQTKADTKPAVSKV